MNSKFNVLSYEVYAAPEGEIMQVKLVKETETFKTTLTGIKTEPKKIGFAGTLDLVIYDTKLQDYYKRQLGKEIDVKIG